MKITRISVFLLLSLSALVSCGQKGVAVEDAWSRPTPAGQNGAAFFLITNGSDQEDVLLSVASDVANVVELHRSVMEDGAMRMIQQPSIPIPANGELLFKPGDFHVMLMGLRQEFVLGESYQLTLTFQEAGEVEVTVRVMEE